YGRERASRPLDAGTGMGQALERFTGYTRPGNPPDHVRPDGQIVLVAAEKIEGAIGGTVYFTVLDRARYAPARSRETAADAWGTGFKGFDKAFHKGLDAMGDASPELDTTARYLYLYQTVNDRKTKTPIRSTSVRLLVPPRRITSWGSFPDITFGFAR